MGSRGTAPNSRPVHPCYMSVWEGTTGAEYVTWAHITNCNQDGLPDLVTAQGSTLNIYTLEDTSAKFLWSYSFPSLAGNVCYLETLPTPKRRQQQQQQHRRRHPDALLVGFAGNPRLAIVRVKSTMEEDEEEEEEEEEKEESNDEVVKKVEAEASSSSSSPPSSSSSQQLLLATTLLDLGPALSDACYGAVTPLEQDLQANLLWTSNSATTATLSVVLGGGVALACVALKYDDIQGWKASSVHEEQQPYLLPLQTLSASYFEKKAFAMGGAAAAAAAAAGTASGGLALGGNYNKSDMAQTIVTGFGDVLDTNFLPGYLEPTLVVLHSNPHIGLATPGRLGRQEGGTRYALQLTAISVSVSHGRSAILWTTEVPADAQKIHVCGKSGCLVICVNSIVAISNTGQLEQCLAVNGWAFASLSSALQDQVQPNPWPFPKLAIALDGCRIIFVNESAAFLILRHGQMYLLQRNNAWSLLPLYSTIGAIGEVSDARCWPLGKILPSALNGKLLDKGKENQVDMGLLFVGSRMGDSTLLGYALESTSVADAIKEDPGLTKIIKTDISTDNIVVDDEYDRILRMEEEALYAPEVSDGPNIIPPSDDEETVTEIPGSATSTKRQRKRARLSQLVVVRSLTILDSITAFGPVGPGCSGPLSQPPEYAAITDPNSTASPPLGATGYVFPCGFGSSGGLALLTAPGRDDRTILAEEDCVNAKAIFSLPSRGIVVMGMAGGGIRFMQLETSPSFNIRIGMEATLMEMTLDFWATEEAYKHLSGSTLLTAAEWNDDIFVLLIESATENGKQFTILLMNDNAARLGIQTEIPINVDPDDTILTVTPIVLPSLEKLSFGYTLSSGGARIVFVDLNGGITEHAVEPENPMDVDDQEITEEEKFYSSNSVSALDIFKAPKSFFLPTKTDSNSIEETQQEIPTQHGDFSVDDDDDEELYGKPAPEPVPIKEEETKSDPEDESIEENMFYVALCRNSGKIEIYPLTDFESGETLSPTWSSAGCGHGAPQLRMGKLKGPAFRAPRMHKLYTREMRFFCCGPTSDSWPKSSFGPRVFCLAVEVSNGDMLLYKAVIDKASKRFRSFSRVPLKNATRPSQEQSKHFSKLRRKGIVAKTDTLDKDGEFRYACLFRFMNLSGQDGLFAALARPIWVVAERGKPGMLCHRSRHAAPAGSRPRPVAGFCSGLINSAGQGESFMTLHERVGRVGSQRLTVFSGILNLDNSHSLVPGGGLFVEKIPFGVTVRRIQFIDDPTVSSASHPLYAVLVSREIETDMSTVNDDGLTPEERQSLADEKENAKIKRQVEADLGGFDIEQEWVEEIEREDCFKVDTNLGGAPPSHTSAYSLWIVDAASGWVVVDSYEFESVEHALCMQVMSLSEFTAEPGSALSEEILDEKLDTKLFITVGTGIVDKDGEDVSSKGRVLLFNVVQPKDKSTSLQIAELNFVYEKKIFHGPVSTLSCLSGEGKHRLVIGAGADVNVEQWGNEKLTQVGFFRATMYVLDIKLFKNFFVLSDAYDSLYFLVWRESDKSLTLLAKDYDPIPVYAAGLLSRGGSLDLVCHDDRQNLQFFQYAPGDPAARGGNKLVCRADFHLGSQTAELQSYFCRSSLLINSATPPSTLAALQQQDKFFGKADDDQRLGVHFGTTDGGYGAIVPLSEPTYWRLTALQSVMVNALESDCALSQRAWRLYRRTPRRGGCRSNDRKKGVIDGDFIIQYIDLSTADQEDLASAIGSTVDLIVDNILELKCSSMVI